MDRIKLAHEVLDLVFKANGGFVERAGNKEPTGEPTAFFAFSGHCPSVDVRIFPEGWHFGVNYNKKAVDFTFSRWHTDEEDEEELNRLREYVDTLIETKEEEQHD